MFEHPTQHPKPENGGDRIGLKTFRVDGENKHNPMKSRSTDNSNDERFLSQSFSGASSLLRSKPRADFASNNHLSAITCSGYLLKRSNEPLYQHPAIEDNSFIVDSLAVPDLPHMPGRFSSLQGDESAGTVLTKSPLEGNEQQTSLAAKRAEQHETKTPAEVGIQSVAAFFGLPLHPKARNLNADKAEKTEILESSIVEHRTPITASSPIKVGRPLHERNKSDTSWENPSNQIGVESPISTNEPDYSTGDVVDADGHIWRSKFCILEEGILYFYRNTQDANTAIAVEERQSVRVQVEQNGMRLHSPKDLSKSPVSRGLYSQSGLASTEESNNFIWEKRVFLSSVGSVRSAEQEFGANAFQLEAISGSQNPEKTDTLVLRARNEKDMKEWIFQFHRSLNWFMRSFLKSEIYMDIAYPATIELADSSLLQYHQSGKKLQRFFAPSSRSTDMSETKSSLSHGHGRLSLQRSRQLTTKSMSLDNEEINFGKNPSVTKTDWVSKQEINTTLSPKNVLIDTSRSQNTDPVAGDGDNRSKTLSLSSSRAYIPPHLRRKMQAGQSLGGQNRPVSNEVDHIITDSMKGMEQNDSVDTEVTSFSLEKGPVSAETSGSAIYKKGGCAGQKGSILDSRYVPRKASKLGPSPGAPFGCFGGDQTKGREQNKTSIRWETGAVSQCGIRDSNEDAYLISSDLLHERNYIQMSDSHNLENLRGAGSSDEKVGLFAIFDGHQGDQAARFAAEKLGGFILEEIGALDTKDHEKAAVFPLLDSLRMETTVRNAMARLDREFCCLCHEGGREWESGATALVAMLVDRSLVVANLGDCRGVICRGVTDAESYIADDAWHDVDVPDGNSCAQDALHADSNNYFWREMTRVHSPSVETERQRIEDANGWVTTETEIPIGQLRRIDFRDEDVVKILKRGFSEEEEQTISGPGKQSKAAPQRILEIFRVCGDLSVSRAIGDRDFKAEYNAPRTNLFNEDPSSKCWEGPLYLKYPDQHDGRFRGDLVSCVPDIQFIEVGENGVHNEFLLLACDGLWDVLDADDAIRVTRELLVRKKCDAKQAVSKAL